ncbi:MAG: hypothetical protein A4E57_01626 [Syntrophorhabdaceae bacterium PtaU1.Bin034]|nr:MAG: hypothetical protein A4E57_01626 [Syntrophorhabdaceae bacterium PtaU1.Bin034]
MWLDGAAERKSQDGIAIICKGIASGLRIFVKS